MTKIKIWETLIQNKAAHKHHIFPILNITFKILLCANKEFVKQTMIIKQEKTGVQFQIFEIHFKFVYHYVNDV